MLNDLNTSVATISPEALDKLFEDNPAPVSADDLVVGKESSVKVEADDAHKSPFIQVAHSSDIPEINLDDVEDEPEEGAKDDKKEEKKVEVPKAEEGEKKEEKKEEPKKEDTKSPEDLQVTAELLKSSVDYLISKGIFKDFEGREDAEITEEVFAELLEKQVEEKVQEAYNLKKQSTGEYGQAILDYLEDGGDPDQIIDIFKERKAIQEFDLSSDEAKAQIVAKWYKEVHGWKPEKIKKYVDGLIAEEALDGEADEIKDKYDAHYKQQVDALKEEEKQYKAVQQQKQKAFEQSLSKAIDANADFDDKRKRLIKDSIFKFKTLEDGTKVNDLFLKFAEIQSNPDLYVEFAEWALDREGYLKRKEVAIQNKVVDKSFNFIKGNTALSSNKGSKHPDRQEAAAKEASGTNFSVIFKK